MLRSLVAWSLVNRFAVIALSMFVLAVGFYAALHSRLDVFPEFAPPMVVVQTECPGLGPLDVEQLVTTPIENAVNGVPNLAKLRSQSVQGLSVITAIFGDGTDIHRARQQVTERLAELRGRLPAGVKPPRMAPLMSSTGRLLSVGFTSNKISPLDLRDHVQWLIRPRLLLPGVAQITIIGGDVREYQVHVDPDKLKAWQLTLADVLESVRESTGIRGAGFFENDRQRINPRSDGQLVRVEDLGSTVITRVAGTPVRIEDVASVVEGAEPKFGDALIDGVPGVVLTAYRQLEADTLKVTEELEAELAALRPMLERQGIVYHPRLFRQADFIEHAVGNVAHSLWIGAVLVAIVLFLFLFNLRSAFISLTAIPLSLLGAVSVLWWFDVGLNTLTMGGLAIAIGEVVDDAIIDVENILRRLREQAGLTATAGNDSEQRSVFDVVLAASLEVRGAVVYATFVVVLAFVPIFFLGGLQGRLFAPLALAYVLAVLVSLLVALVVTPALSMALLPGAAGGHDPWLLRTLQAGYERLLRLLDRLWFVGAAVMAVVLLGAVQLFSQFGGEFLPDLKETHFIIHARALPGTSLVESLEMGKTMTRKLRSIEAVESVTQIAGRAELGEDTWGVDYSEIAVPLKLEHATRIDAAQRSLQTTASQTPGVSCEVFTFLSERIKELLAGTPATLAIQVHGESLDDIDRAARDIASLLSATPGSVQIRVEAQTGVPEIVARIRGDDASRFGLRRVQILDTIQTAFQGADGGQVFHGPRIVDLRVLLAPNYRRDLASVRNLSLALPGHVDQGTVSPADGPAQVARIPLSSVADVFHSEGRILIAHEGGLRRQQVSCNVNGRDTASFVAEVQAKLADLKLPANVFVTLSGEHEAHASARRELLFWSSLAGVGILLLLWVAYGGLGKVVLILANLPFALVGGVLAVWLNGGILDVGSLIGFVTLFGITTRNSMMLVSHWQHLHDVEGMPWGVELIFRGARERLAPVLMTALVTGLGLLPIAWGAGKAGREIEGPMAWVILGGLATSTALNLLLLPIFYHHWLRLTGGLQANHSQ